MHVRGKKVALNFPVIRKLSDSDIFGRARGFWARWLWLAWPILQLRVSTGTCFGGGRVIQSIAQYFSVFFFGFFHTELGARMHGFDSENILLDFSVFTVWKNHADLLYWYALQAPAEKSGFVVAGGARSAFQQGSTPLPDSQSVFRKSAAGSICSAVIRLPL